MKKLLKILIVFSAFLLATNKAYPAGIDLTQKHQYYGIVSTISLETGKIYSGMCYVVDNGHSLASDNTSNGDFERPFSTIDYAIGRAKLDKTANLTHVGDNRGDLVVCLPGSTTSITTAGGLDIDCAGITLYSLGHGSDRHTITLSGTEAADIDFDAANVSMYNFLIYAGTQTVVLDINADDVMLAYNETRDISTQGVTAGSAVNWIRTGTGVDRLTVKGHTHFGTDGTPGLITNPYDSIAQLRAPSTFAQLIGGVQHKIYDFNIFGNFDHTIFEVGTGEAATDYFEIHDGYAWNKNSNDSIGSSTINSNGRWGPNLWCRIADNASNITEAIRGVGAQIYQPIYIVNADGEVGTPTNITFSTD